MPPPRHSASWLAPRWLTVVLLVAATAVRAQELAAFESTVRAWIEVERAIDATRDDWDEQRVRLEAEKALLGRRLRDARNAEAAALKARDSARTERDQAAAGAADASRGEAAYKPVVRAASARLLQLVPRLPAPLQQSLAEQLPVLERPLAAGEEGDRLRIVLAMLAEIEQFDAGVHVVRQSVSAGDDEREYDVLYLGLSQAFAASPSGDRAAVGRPSAAGLWTWVWTPELGPGVRALIDIYRKERRAELVTVPLQVGETP